MKIASVSVKTTVWTRALHTAGSVISAKFSRSSLGPGFNVEVRAARH